MPHCSSKTSHTVEVPWRQKQLENPPLDVKNEIAKTSEHFLTGPITECYSRCFLSGVGLGVLAKACFSQLLSWKGKTEASVWLSRETVPEVPHLGLPHLNKSSLWWRFQFIYWHWMFVSSLAPGLSSAGPWSLWWLTNLVCELISADYKHKQDQSDIPSILYSLGLPRREWCFVNNLNTHQLSTGTA